MTDIERFENELFPEEQTPQGFVVDSLSKAEWAMNKVARAEHRIQAITELAEQAVERIRKRAEEITDADRRTVAAMGDMIRPWAETEIAKNGKARSVKLLGGTVGFRASPARLEVTDETKAINWLEDNFVADGVRVKKEVNKVVVKEIIESTGQVPDGCELVPGKQNFYIKAERPEIENKEESNVNHRI